MTLSQTFAALGDPTRHKILQILKERDMSAGEIAEHFDMTAPSISHHLGVLKQADLVNSRRVGQEIIYSLNLSFFEETANAAMSYFKRPKKQK